MKVVEHHVGLHRFMVGHVLDGLSSLPDSSVNCCVTSPPYFQLRSYQGEPQIWGGVGSCTHVWEGRSFYSERTAAKDSAEAFSAPGQDNQERLKNGRWRDEAVCLTCGAWKGQMGQENSPDAFLRHLLMVMREVRRVLRPDGTLWLNLGDSFARDRSKGAQGVRAKSLLGIPWRVALAMTAEGWILRSDIVWAKPNPCPEPVRDRPTRSHEYFFLFAQEEKYYYHQDAIREPVCAASLARNHRAHSVGTNPNRLDAGRFCGTHPAGRNRRSVWNVPTGGYKGAHFSTFPPALIEPAILAGCPEGGVVLDPFGGSGTVSAVAAAYGRGSILIDLDPGCEPLWRQRLLETNRVLEGIG